MDLAREVILNDLTEEVDPSLSTSQGVDALWASYGRLA